MISILVPVYNEKENIAPLYNELKTICKEIGDQCEIILIDDGSTDGSYQALRELSRRDAGIRVIKLRRNYGQTTALQAGFNSAKGNIIISMDADLQNDPADIPKLLEKMKEGYDVVCGWRVQRKDPLGKKIPSKISNWLAKRLTGIKIHDLGCSLRAYRREAVENLELYGELHRYIPALIVWKGFKVTEVEVNHRPRGHGKTKYGLFRLVSGFLDLLLVKFLMSYSSRPMLVFGGLGLILMLIGFVSGLYLVMEKYLFGASIADRPLLILAVLFIVFGIQSLSIGVLADMVNRIHYKSKKAYDIE